MNLASSTSTPAIEPIAEGGVANAAGRKRPGGVRRRAMSAAMWTFGPRPINIALSLARNLILARLLMPEDFGLAAIISVCQTGLAMVSDVGLEPSVVRHERGDDERFLRTIWTLQILRGFVLFLGCVALAYPVAWFYGEPILAPLMIISGLTPVISGFRSTARMQYKRHMNLRRFTILSTALKPVNLAVIVLMAWWFRDVWGLVLGAVAIKLINMPCGHIFLNGIKHRLAWDREAVREVATFGRWVFVSTIFTFGAMQSDRLILGALVPMNVLGIYSIAMVLASVAHDIVKSISGTVLFPALSVKFRTDPGQRDRRVRRARGVVLHAGLILAVGMIAVAPAFLHYAYPTRFADAGWVAQLLGVSVWLMMLSGTSSQVLLALGESKALAQGNAFNLVVTILASIAGFYLNGIIGFVAGYAVGTAACEVVLGWRARKLGVSLLWQDAVLTVLFLLVVDLMLLVEAANVEAGLGLMPWQTLLANLAIWGVLALCCGAGMKRELFPHRRIPLLDPLWDRFPCAGMSTIRAGRTESER